MKQKLVKVTRKTIPKPVVKKIEKVYRKNRLRVLSNKYKNPAQKIKTLAITGTNGKTTSISMLNQIIKEAGYTTILSTTAGVEIAGDYQSADACQTVPQTERLQQLYKTAVDKNIDYFLLETTSHALEQYKIPKMDLQCAGLTNLSQEHLDYHQNMESYAEQKIKLFTNYNAKNIILNADDKWFDYFRKKIGEDFYCYGTESNSDFQIKKVKLFKQGTDILIKYKDEEIELSTPMGGLFNAYNAVLAASMAKRIGIKNNDIINGLANFDGVKGRLEWIENDLGIDVIVDYAHTPDGIEKLLDFAKSISKGKVNIVFGAAGDRDQTKRPIMGEVASKLADRIFLTDEESCSENPQKIREDIMKGIIGISAEEKAIEIEDRGEAIRAALEVADKGDIVVITGLGHQMKREVGKNEYIDWNDTKETEKILREIEEERQKN